MGGLWYSALQDLLRNNNYLEKNFCFLGFPDSARDLDFICRELNWATNQINKFFGKEYWIPEVYLPSTMRTGLNPNQDVMNMLHNHFEHLQGTVWELSDYYRRADYNTKYAIRQLNNLCHEIENLILGQRKANTAPYWVRPSQITTFLQAERYDLNSEHRKGFATNGYDRVLGGVYMHWTQIGKTLFEVFRDEGAPELTDTVCEAINELKFYSGEFDVEWGNDVTMGGNNPWHNKEQEEFRSWLIANDRDPNDPKLSLGYLPLGQIELQSSFGTTDYQQIWDMLGDHLDIYQIEINGVSNTFEYCWSDPTYKQMQIDIMKPGYDYSSRG